MFYADRVGLAHVLRARRGASIASTARDGRRRRSSQRLGQKAATFRELDRARVGARRSQAHVERLRPGRHVPARDRPGLTRAPYAAPAAVASSRNIGTDTVARSGRTVSCTCTAAHRRSGPTAARITDRLEHWAARAPTRPFLAQRDRSRRVADACTYGAGARRRARAPGAGAARSAALGRTGRSSSCPATASSTACSRWPRCTSACPYAPIAPAYSLQARDFGTLAQIFDRDAARAWCSPPRAHAFERAFAACCRPASSCVVSASAPAGLPSTPVRRICRRRAPGSAVDAARDAVGPDTHRQGPLHLGIHRPAEGRDQHAADAVLEPGDDPLGAGVPRRRAAGALRLAALEPHRRRQPQLRPRALNGGTLLHRRGQADAAALRRTLRNLREIPATAHFTVPRSYEMLLPHLRSDPVLRETFFRAEAAVLRGGGPGPAVLGRAARRGHRGLRRGAADHDRLRRHRDRAVRVCTGPAGAVAGVLGLPAPRRRAQAGAGRREARGARAGSEHHARLLARRGADARGVRRGGLLPARRRDALRRSGRIPAKGLVFDGRLAEDFKLSTGTWVSVGPLRVAHPRPGGRPGAGRRDCRPRSRLRRGAGLPEPRSRAARSRARLRRPSPRADVLAHPRVRAAFAGGRRRARRRRARAARRRGARHRCSTSRRRSTPREITDKGSLNQKAVLASARAARRRALRGVTRCRAWSSATGNRRSRSETGA